MQALLAQLTLSLHSHDEATFAGFYQGKNAEIIAELQRSATGQGERFIYLCGAIGEGCSHLLQACCHEAHQSQRTSVYLPLKQLRSLSVEMLAGLESLSLICIDDLEVIAGQPEWEEAIFHLFNRVYDAGSYLVMAGHDVPKSLHIQLPDLVSRLSFAAVYALQPLTDEEKLAVLNCRAEGRGIHLAEEVGRYILTHCPRQMSTLFAALDLLDNASLAAKRKLTIPFIKEILQL